MKKSLKLLPLALASIFLSSCGVLTMAFGDENTQEDPYTFKQSMNDFSHLNNPIVLNLPLVIYDTAFNGELKSDTYHPSTLHVVYDWEQDEVFDWMYVNHDYFAEFTAYPNTLKYGNDIKYSYSGSSSNKTVDIFTNGKTENVSHCQFAPTFSLSYPSSNVKLPMEQLMYETPYIPGRLYSESLEKGIVYSLCVFDWRTWKPVIKLEDINVSSIISYAYDNNGDIYIEYSCDKIANNIIQNKIDYVKFDSATKTFLKIKENETAKVQEKLSTVYVDGKKIRISVKNDAANTKNTVSFTVNDKLEQYYDFACYDCPTPSILNIGNLNSTLYALVLAGNRPYLVNLEDNSKPVELKHPAVDFSSKSDSIETAYFRGKSIYFMTRHYDGEPGSSTVFWIDCYKYDFTETNADKKWEKISFKPSTLL